MKVKIDFFWELFDDVITLIKALFFGRPSYINFESWLIVNSNPQCVKSVQKWSFFWSPFSCVRTKYGNLLRKSLYLDIFHVVQVFFFFAVIKDVILIHKFFIFQFFSIPHKVAFISN